MHTLLLISVCWAVVVVPLGMGLGKLLKPRGAAALRATIIERQDLASVKE